MSTPYEFFEKHGYSFTQEQVDTYEERGELSCGVPFTFKDGQPVIKRRFTTYCSPQMEAALISLREELGLC